MKSVFVVAVLLLLVTTAYSFDKFRRFHINETISTRIFLRCPLSWSDEDTILFYQRKNNGEYVQLNQELETRDALLLDVAPEKQSRNYECTVTHKKDGSKEIVSYFIDRQTRFRDIQKLIYSITTTTIKDVKIGDSFSLECPIKEKNANYLWFDPDLLQLNNSVAKLEIATARVGDFGEYFCGTIELLNDRTLTVHKFVVKLPSVPYDPNLKNVAKSLLYPTYKLGERIVYQPPTAYTLTRRLIWEDPPTTVLLNQGRDFHREIFTHDMTQEEFYYRESDRIDPSYFSAKRILFQSQKMGERSFSVNINPSPATVIIGNSIELFCNNSNNLKSIWYYKPSSTSMRQNLPAGVVTRVDGLYSIVHINTSEQSHAGIYECDAKKATAIVVLTVAPQPKIIISPREVIIRPGASARFLCQLINASGKVIWRRKDNNAFRLNVESRIGGDTQAILSINSVPKELNGSVYECIHNSMIDQALLMVRDLCPPNQRACNAGNCIDESRFCDGTADCQDKSDEDLATCAKCEPNQRACVVVDNKNPLQKCVVKHWYCDGDNDCGNGFDELNCPKIDKNTCLSTNFVCNDNQTLIPRSLWCDKSPNCPNGDDEFFCREPEVVLPTKETTYVVHRNSSISLVCEVVSVPTSTINWRYNWGTLPNRLNFTIIQTGTDCNRIRNTLTIHNMNADHAGVYTCEAVSTARAMAKDYTIFVTTENLCKKPYFNNAASIKEMCLKCFCSNVTDDCTSATGFIQSSTPKVSTYSRAQLMNFMTKRIMETGNSKALFDPQTRIYKFSGDNYKSLVMNPNIYLTSHFGLSGSWLQSYSFFLIIKMKLTGLQFDELNGPAVVIKSSTGKSLHWCRSDNSPVIHSLDTGLVNTLKLSLWEKEDWYNNIACSVSASREDFLNVLTDVSLLLIRIKYYSNQSEFELHNITLEHAIPITKEGEAGVLVPRIEMCQCPFPYSGLSCEKCVDSYTKNSKNKCVKKCPKNCEECIENSDCIKCKGNRSGPRCLQCKSGFTRAVDKDMTEDCVHCPCREQYNMSMIGNECVRDLLSNGRVQCHCTGKEVNDPVCNTCLRRPIQPGDEKKCINKTKTENEKCNQHGTLEIINKACKCKMGYKGQLCEECKAGFFQHDGQCLKCFCSNISNQCQASSDYRFVNLTLNSQDYNLQIMLSNRQLSGVYEAEGKDGDVKVNRPRNTIVVKRNSNEKGLIYVTIKVNDTENPNNINVYTMIYGGKIMFKFEYMTEDLKSLTFNDVMPFLEIESKKLGRLWVPFKYNDITKFMEVTFTESFFPAWKIDKNDGIVDRETLIRALMTNSHISIGISFNNEIVKKVRISEFTIEHAKKQSGLGKVAPIEVCPCTGAGSGIKCEACNKPGFTSVMTLSSRMPDFECGQCTSESCPKCPDGSYNYDFLLNKNFTLCQQGIEITTRGRVIKLNRGESLSIPCSVKSYKGGVAVHTWSKRDGKDQLSTFRHITDDGLSHLILYFEKIQLSDSGFYICHTKNAFSNASEEFFIEVTDNVPRLTVDVSVETIGKQNVKLNASIFSPKSPSDYKVIWSVVKDGKVTTEESHKIKVVTEQSQYKIDVEITTNVTEGVQLRGVIIGSRVTNPFFYEVRFNITRNITIPIGSVHLSTDKNVLNLKFLESGVIRIITAPSLRIETFWFKVTANGTEEPLPYGISARGNELIVWSASERHNGKYVGYVINTGDGTSLGRVHTEINVTPIIPNIGREMFNVTRETNVTISLYVPLTQHCPEQSWELHNPRTGVLLDITKNVIRISEKEVVINYPLGLGDVVRFRCFVIPDANLTGEIKILLESKYPIIETMPKFEKSIYPVSLECIDKNTMYASNISWYFNNKPIGKNSIINWTLLGGFQPIIHEGQYTCFASNLYNNASKAIHLPETRTGTAPGYIKITSSTNEIAFKNGTLRIYLMAGQKLQVGASLIGLPPVGTEIKWFVNNNSIKASKSGKLFSSLEITVASTEEHCGVYRVQVLLPNGTTAFKIFEVVPHRSLEYYAKIDGLNPNGDLSILEGDNRVIGCQLMKRENNTENEESNVKIIWTFVDNVGATKTINDIVGLKRASNNRAIDVVNARSVLNRYRGQCVINFNGVNYTSKFFSFDVNQRNIDPRVKLIGLVEEKYVENEEGATSGLTCRAYDENSKRDLPNAEYKWEMTYDVQNKKRNWEKMTTNENKITFGGLIYHKLSNSAVGRCRVNYFTNIIYSTEFSFRIKRKESNVTLPKVKINVIFDSKRPPYPVAVSCRDPNVRPDIQSNITFVVSNPYFERNSVTTKEGLLVINFTTNGTDFNPFKDSGVYTFTVTNKFGSKAKQVILPQEKNPNKNYSANIAIFSPTGQIENNRIRVKANSEFKLLCVYYGHPVPISLKLTVKKTDHSTPVIESTDYWTSVTIQKFNVETNSGEYECTGQSHQGPLTKKVIVEGYSYGIKVEILREVGTKWGLQTSLPQGDNFVTKYRTIDLFTNKVVTNIEGIWEFRFSTSDNFTEINNVTFTGEEVTFDGDKMTIKRIAHPGLVEIRCKFPYKGEMLVTESIVVNVLENERLHPVPYLVPVYRNGAYPENLQCSDNSSQPSNVSLTKVKGIINEKLQYVYEDKKSIADWSKLSFSPFYDSGNYKCEAKNRYKTNAIFKDLPEARPNKQFIPYVEFESRINEIVVKEQNKTIEVIDGTKFMIICNYYGTKAPISDVDIVFQSRSGEAHLPMTFVSKLELKSYFSSITIDKFNLTMHSGTYTCRSRTQEHNLTAIVTVQGIKPGLHVFVEGLDSVNNVKLTLGSTRSFKCRAIDTVTKNPVTTVKYDWILETMKGAGFNIDDLSEIIKKKDGNITLGVVKINENLRGRCEVTNKNSTFYSPYFEISIVEDALKKPKLQFVEILGSEERGFPISLRCVDLNKNISDITITYLSGSLSDTVVNKSKNSFELIFPYNLSNPLLYVGSYRCEGTNKYGKGLKLTELKYVPKSIPLAVRIESKDVKIVSKLNVKTIDIPIAKRIEFDCIYSGDKPPIAVNWHLIENAKVTKLEKDKPFGGFVAYQKRSDCLSLVQEGFTEKTSLRLNCSAQDNTGAVKSDNVQVNAIVIGTKIVIVGLDNDTYISATQGSNKVLICKVLDLNSDIDISNNFTIVWQFTDDKGQKIELDQLSSKVNTKYGMLDMNSLVNLDKTLTGQCVASNSTNRYKSITFKYIVKQDAKKRPKITFAEEYGINQKFPAKLQCIEINNRDANIIISRIDKKPIRSELIITANGSTILMLPSKESEFESFEGGYSCTATNKYGSDQASLNIALKELLTVTLNSTINKIVTDKFGNLSTIVRKNRKLELNCYVTGTPPPKVILSIITEGYNPDLPIAARKIGLVPKDVNSPYQVEVVTNKHYKLSRSYYSQSPPSSFSCDATSNGKMATSVVKVIEVDDIFKVNIVSNQRNQLNQIVFLDKPFEIGCEMKDNKNQLVKIHSIQWSFKDQKGNDIDLKKVAKTVQTKGNMLSLEGVSVAHGSLIRGRCAVYYNDTYDTLSDEFNLNIMESPKITGVFAKLDEGSVKSTKEFPFNLTYDAMKSTEINCLANTTNGVKPSIKWIKCSNDNCSSSVEVDSGSSLIFFEETTKYTDIGQYRCLVTLTVDNNILSEAFGIIDIKRKAAPKQHAPTSLDAKQSVTLICDNTNSSPEGNLTWTFIPKGSSTVVTLPTSSIIKTKNQISTLIINKPLKPEYSGTYICNVTNEYGSGGRKFIVNVKSYLRQ